MFAWSRNDTRNDIKSKILSSLVWISKEFLWSTVPVSFYRSSRYITKLSVDRNPILGLESAKKQTRIPVVLSLYKFSVYLSGSEAGPWLQAPPQTERKSAVLSL
jgi:hypothetical protein